VCVIGGVGSVKSSSNELDGTRCTLSWNGADDCDGEYVCVWLGDCVSVCVILAVCVMLGEVDGVIVSVRDGCSVKLGVWLWLLVCELLGVPDSVKLGVWAWLAVCELLGVLRFGQTGCSGLAKCL